jgi:hypothetical protein
MQVDMYAKVEEERLQYIRDHQTQLRADIYKGVRDATRVGDTDVASMGHRIILPSTFAGSLRNRQEAYMDTMAVVRAIDAPHIFTTFTTNPHWAEIEEEMQRIGATSALDIMPFVQRIFELKFHAYIDFIVKSGVYGRVRSIKWVIEDQKRGLPHGHILITLHEDSIPRSAEDVDKLISAQLPDPVEHPVLHGRVAAFMMHGPHTDISPCMRDGKCKDHYPKEFGSETVMLDEEYPQYARPNNGRMVSISLNQHACMQIPHFTYHSCSIMIYITLTRSQSRDTARPPSTSTTPG